MYVKTTMWKSNVGKEFEKFAKHISNSKPEYGYCETQVDNMNSVSNQAFCRRNAKARNGGFYIRVTFANAYPDAKWSFRLPMDFGLGGVSMLDGKIIKKTHADIWQKGKSRLLDFEMKLSKGNHILELYGAESCCGG